MCPTSYPSFIFVVKWSTNIRCSHTNIHPNIVWSLICLLNYPPYSSWIFVYKVWAPYLVTLPCLLCQHTKQETFPVGSNLVSYTIACVVWLEYNHYVCKTEIVEPSCAQSMVIPLQRYGSISVLKWDSYSLTYGITEMLSKSMYNFINGGIVGKSCSCNFRSTI